ncbi:MAG: polyphenol oxidase family protein [Candidatus Hydrogenedentes bacterium]|nr:polyphenol oxidase family protein [Candidatus Hydrogenedentota bacterium]
MYQFQSLLDAGAVVAAMSDVNDGDCGCDGIDTGVRSDFLNQAGVPPEDLFTLHQVHGCHIRVVDGKQMGQGAHSVDEVLGDGDGLITIATGIPLGVTVADCVPVLLFDPTTRAVAALHAGRDGTTAGIALRGLNLLVSEFGVNPADVHGVIGPSAGPCCYEVSEEIRSHCVSKGVIARVNHLDLWASNYMQLMDGGVKSENIEVSERCTICSSVFFSYRRQQSACRNIAVIMA